MNTLLVFTLLVAACAADVSHIVSKEATAGVIRHEQDQTPDGSFKYLYETENGIAAQAQALPTGETQGSYRYIDSEGKPVEVTWTAGPNGFVAQGSGIPATPESVLRALDFIAAHPYKEPISP